MRRAFLVLPLLLVGVFVAGCPKTTSNQVLVLIQDVAKSTQAFEQEVRIANRDGAIDDVTEAKLLGIDRLITLEDAAASSAVLKQGNAVGAIAHIDAAIADLDGAVANDLLGIKNAGEKASIQAILVGLRGSLVTAKALLTK